MTQSIRPTLCSLLLCFLVLTACASCAEVAPWITVGPDGGDARSFAQDPSNPSHLYLGTTDSWIYETEDEGATWKPLAKLHSSDNLIIDHIVVSESDPKTLMVGAWVVDHPDGGLFLSHDSGKTWTTITGMKGQSIRALAQAPSNPQVFVAGTLRGVFRSDDGGLDWTQISPQGSMELHELESIAIDPQNPSTIYAGTWHLPWKTTDGGVTWHNIKQGLIDDSDVFSILVDPIQTNVVYTSACSGIYRSDNGGELYHKVQGIPSTARRTRMLKQDPVDHNTVYAGTTEGLYKTIDGGVTWKRMTGPDVIINDVYVDPKNNQHVLLATDRSGVLESSDAGVSFKPSNSGFSQRQVTSLLVDANLSRTIYAGVVNDKSYGGVFVSSDQGQSWRQQSAGLEGRDVFSLAQAADGSLLAGTNAGIFHWNGSEWQADGKIVTLEKKTSYEIRHGKRTKVEKSELVPNGEIDGRVSAMHVSGDLWTAATSSGVYTSRNQGVSWQGGAVLGKKDFLAVAAAGDIVMAAQRAMLAVSSNGGVDWQPIAMPTKLSWIQSLAVAPNGSFWLGGGEGVFYSEDHGQTWQQMSTLPISDISSVTYDSELRRLIVTSWRSTWVMAIDPASRTWKWWDAGWTVRHVRSAGGRLVAATMYNGVVLQPQSVTTASAAGPAQ